MEKPKENPKKPVTNQNPFAGVKVEMMTSRGSIGREMFWAMFDAFAILSGTLALAAQIMSPKPSVLWAIFDVFIIVVIFLKRI